jgi:hypothetical protein
MRSLVIALGVLLIALPASAQNNPGAVRSYGSVTCRQSFSCQVTSDIMTAIYPLANSCVNQYFGYPIGDGFFDESAGLDSNNCLVAKPNVLPKGIGSQLSPLCCVAPMQGSSGNSANDACQIHCSLMSSGR